MALLGAGLFGFSNLSSGISANGTKLSSKEFRAELTAITQSPNLQCYLSAIAVQNFSPGSGDATITGTAAGAWANLRVEGIAIDQYVTSHFHVNFSSAKEIALATSSLEGELTQAAQTNSLSCPGASADAIAAMPSEMRKAEIEDQAASMYLLGKLNTTIAITAPNIQTYYEQHISSYDTICVSVAVVSPAQVAAFSADESSGATVAQLAKKYSVDKSAVSGGSYGCYGPTNSSYAAVRSDTVGLALNKYSTPQSVTYSGQTFALFVAATKRTTTPFTQAASAVVSDVQHLNASSASTIKSNILYAAAITVDPAFGRWGLSKTTGPGIFAPALPASGTVTSPSILTAANSTKYQ